MSEEVETISVPSTGARLCLLIAVLLGIVTVYLMTSPVQTQTSKGMTFSCGTVLEGPKTNFARGICGTANDAQKDKAVATGVAAAVIAIGGFLVFGMSTRPRRRDENDEMDEIDESDEDGGRAAHPDPGSPNAATTVTPDQAGSGTGAVSSAE